jgi:hypothetical protein
MRKDVYITNDAGSWSVVAADAVERIVDDYRNDDKKFVDAYEAALFAIEGDDSNVVRIVVGESLTEAEDQEWIAVSRWRLKASGGKVLICGGFDPDCLADWQQDGETCYIKEIDVTPGDYHLSFYTYLHSMNGAMWQEDFYGKPLLPKIAPWFRRDHAGRSLPTWLVSHLSDDDLDDGDEWKPLVETVKSGRVVVEREPLHWIGYLFHLTPFLPEMELDRHSDGWFDSKERLRVPAHFPLGIATDCTSDTEIKNRVTSLFDMMK